RGASAARTGVLQRRRRECTLSPARVAIARRLRQNVRPPAVHEASECFDRCGRETPRVARRVGAGRATQLGIGRSTLAAHFTTSDSEHVMPRYVIERDIPQIGSAEREALRQAAQKSNGVLAEMQAEKKAIQWEHSYVAGDKTFCIYHAANEG